MGIRHSSRKEISKVKKYKDPREDSDLNASTTPSTVVSQEQCLCKDTYKPQEHLPSSKSNNGPPKPCAGVYSQEETGHQNHEKEHFELDDVYINPINQSISATSNHLDEQAAIDEKGKGADLATESVSELSADEEFGEYDRIDGVSAHATEDSKYEISTPCFDNIEYFKRGGNERTSQRTTSSNADSAYTDSTNNTQCCHSLTDDYFCLDCLSCRNKNMEYMTDVYKRTLQRDLQVSDVLQELHFIDELKRDEISKKAKESGQAAVEMLLEAVKSAEEVGKWQAFIEALERTDYRFLVKLLKGETENDHEKNKKLLSLLSRQLINNINIDECLDKLYESELLNERDKEAVEAEKRNYGPIAAAYKMFNIVPTRSLEWNKKLPEILEQFHLGDIAKLLHFANEEPPESKNSETNIKESKSSHRSSKRHYCHRIDIRSHGHEVNRHKTNYRTSEVHVSTEESKRITDLSKHARDIDIKVQEQLTVLTKLKNDHYSDVNELKVILTKTSNDVRTHATMLKEQEVSLADIKSELKRQSDRVRELQSRHERQFVELKTSLSDIKNSISALTKIIDLSPPEACKKPKMVVDSGFSGSCGSIQRNI